MNSRTTSKMDMEYLEKTQWERRTPRKTGTMWVDWPVNSKTMMAGATVLVAAPDTAAAPIMEYIPSSIY